MMSVHCVSPSRPPSSPAPPAPPTRTSSTRRLPRAASRRSRSAHDAGLVDTLKGAGPFTVFAPTDEAFAKVPKATLDALLADKAKLTAVLTYHVVAGKVMAADVVKAKEAKTVKGVVGEDRQHGRREGRRRQVVKTDIVASNGVIHVIDAVMMPGM